MRSRYDEYFYKSIKCDCGFHVGGLYEPDLLKRPKDFHCVGTMPFHHTCGKKFSIALDVTGKKKIIEKIKLVDEMERLLDRVHNIKWQLSK